MAADVMPSGAAVRLRQARRFAVRLLEHRSFLIGSVLFLAIVACAALAGLLAPDDPNRNDYTAVLFGAERRPPVRTASGCDIFARVLHGARVSLFIGLSVVLGTGIAGVVIGTLAAYVDALDGVFMRTMGMGSWPSPACCSPSRCRRRSARRRPT